MHIIAGTCDLVETHIGEIEGCTITMAALRYGVDVSTTLEVLDILLCAQNRRDIKPIVREVVAAEYIRPLFSDSIEFAFGRRNEEGYGMCETVDDIIAVGMNLNQSCTHGCGIFAVLRRSRESYTRGYGMLPALQVVELGFIVECSSGIGNHIGFGYLGFFVLRLVSMATGRQHEDAKEEGCYEGENMFQECADYE